MTGIEVKGKVVVFAPLWANEATGIGVKGEVVIFVYLWGNEATGIGVKGKVAIIAPPSPLRPIGGAENGS